MELRPTTADEVAPHETEPPSLRLTWEQTSWTLPGAMLEGLWQAGRDLLAVTSDGVPYEDGLHLCLLSPGGTVAEEITALAAYSTGTFEVVGLDGPSLRFTFFDTPPWRLTVEAAPAWRSPLGSTPRGTRRRPFSLRSRLTLIED